jgi:hypothetical protein
MRTGQCTRPIRSAGALVAAALVACAPGALESPQPEATAVSPEATVTALYSYHFAHDMGFTPDVVSERSAWLAPELLDLCRAYFARPVPEDEVPPINGDPFTDSQEYPTRFRVDPVEATSTRALVPVFLSWPHGEVRRVNVHVRQTGDAWLVTDLTYESGPSFRELLTEGR